MARLPAYRRSSRQQKNFSLPQCLTSTDSAGRFALAAPLGAGTYNITVFAPGFVASSDSIAVGVAAELAWNRLRC
ncbi:MAG TPA: carboxypeptidase-like regulatory domain-containing protein [Nitrososphaera sp.]|nr:carboxypeptidase-like regulatory domain-containing protein [Nitrososphaera sp.]